jgi:hypothetical protein
MRDHYIVLRHSDEPATLITGSGYLLRYSSVIFLFLTETLFRILSTKQDRKPKEQGPVLREEKLDEFGTQLNISPIQVHSLYKGQLYRKGLKEQTRNYVSTVLEK